MSLFWSIFREFCKSRKCTTSDELCDSEKLPKNALLNARYPIANYPIANYPIANYPSVPSVAPRQVMLGATRWPPANTACPEEKFCPLIIYKKSFVASYIIAADCDRADRLTGIPYGCLLNGATLLKREGAGYFAANQSLTTSVVGPK